MWLWIGAAWAGTPVVFEVGAGAEVVAFVAERTGLPASQLEATSLDTLLRAPPAALGDAVLRRCTRDDSDKDRIRAELSRAEVAWKTRDDIAARDHLDLAVAQLGCLTELPERPVAARIFVLRGVLEMEGDPEAARGELRTALAFVPELTPDARYASVIGTLLEEERARPASLSLALVPGEASSGPWIDGQDVDGDTVKVRAGLHLAQSTGPTGVTSGWLVVGGDSTLVVPTSFRHPVLEALSDPERTPLVESLVGATLPEQSAVYVAHQSGLWLLTTDGSVWSTMQVAAPAEDAPEEGTGGRKKDRKKKR